MKKIILIFLILATSSLIALIYFSSSRASQIEFYTIKEDIGYIDNGYNKMTFEIYSNKENTLLDKIEDNTYTISENNFSQSLNVIECQKLIYDNYTLYKIITKMLSISDNLDLIAPTLSIKNSKYTVNLKLGSISITKAKDRKLLSINDLYATYTKIDDTLHLIGFNLEFTKEYQNLREFKTVSTLANFDYIKFDTNYDNEEKLEDILKGYNPLTNNLTDNITLKSNRLFIPISYTKLSLIRTTYLLLTLDEKHYYIDQISYLASDINPFDYLNLKQQGEILYA